MPSDVQISYLNEPFDGCNSSARITITDLKGSHQEHFQIGIIEAEEVYLKIEKGLEINLDNRLIKDFSLDAYRSSRSLASDQEIELKDFSARSSVFDGDVPTDFAHALFTGSQTTFTDCIFGDGTLSFYSSNFSASNTDFSRAKFGAGIANFQYAQFAGDALIFDKAHFETGDVHFINCSFSVGKISFKEVAFGEGDVDFHYTQFGDGSITFDKSIFGGGEVSFKRVDFGHGKLDFKRVNFGDGHIDFSESSFKSGKVVFRSATFGNGKINFEECVGESDFIFDNAEFGDGTLSFFKANIRKLSFKLCQFDNHVDLRIAKGEKIDLSYTIVRDIIDMMPTETAPVELQQMNFSGLRNLGNIYIDWNENDVLKLITSQEETTLRQKSEQFLVLKETYDTTGRYADEDKAYIWYKRYELRADLEYSLKQNPSSAIWAYPTAFFKWLLFDKIGLYATEPLRVLFSVTVIYTLFSLSYLVLPLFTDTYIDTGGGETLENLNPVVKAFYYSAITFLTVGYGEYYPVGIMRLLASIEGYVGVFLMGYFSVAFVRKVLR